MPVFVIPFSIFFACGVAQFFYVNRVKRALSSRHPHVLQQLVGKSFFSFDSNAIAKFAWRRRDIGLNDPRLTERVKQFKLLLIVAYGAWGLCMLAMVTGVAFKPITLDGLMGHAPAASVHSPSGPIGAAPSVPATDVTPTLGAVFPAALAGNLIYLILAWRLSARWNALGLGTRASLGDALGVLGVVWWSKPATRDPAFLRLRVVTRAAFILALVGTFILFGLAYVTAR